MLSHVVVARFTDHLPYYRQEQIYARAGVELSRQKLGRWAEHVALLLQGLQGQLRERILQSGYCQADETPVDVIDAERPGATRSAWLWTYHAPQVPAVVFDFRLSRGRDGPAGVYPRKVAGGFADRWLRTLPGTVCGKAGHCACGCMAHARRKWVEAIDGGGEVVAGVLADFAALYRIEAEGRERQLSAMDRAQLRQNRSELVLARLRQKLEVSLANALPQSRVGLAASYAVSRWPSLCRFAEPGYGHVEIDNNPLKTASGRVRSANATGCSSAIPTLAGNPQSSIPSSAPANSSRLTRSSISIGCYLSLLRPPISRLPPACFRTITRRLSKNASRNLRRPRARRQFLYTL